MRQVGIDKFCNEHCKKKVPYKFTVTYWQQLVAQWRHLKANADYILRTLRAFNVL